MSEPPESLRGLTFSVIGCGKVGSSLAHWAVAQGASLSRVASRSSTSAAALADQLGATVSDADVLDSSADDLLLIAVSDTALRTVARRLAARSQAPVALHTSGREDASLLAALRVRGSAVGSLHPLRAFPRASVSAGDAAGTVFAVDGDPAAQDLAHRLARAWHGIAVEVPAENRSLYHLAATLAAGGVVTLLASAVELAGRIGLPPEVADGYAELAEGALRQARDGENLAAAITGPLARGDLEGFRGQLAQLRLIDPQLAEVVERLGELTLRLCAPPVEGPSGDPRQPR